MTVTFRAGLSVLIATSLFAIATVQAAAQSLIRDTEIEETLKDFTVPIVRAAGLNEQAVDLYIVNDQSLNAFVTNGQKIFLHTGIITEAKTPNMLKGVIAHETGHIADGRLARSDYQNRSAYGAMLLAAGVGLAAILAGEGEAGALILGGSQQFGMLEVLSHTRVGEKVADQYAAEYLERTGQSGMGLIQFFEKFRAQEILSQAKRYPYFRTHPLSSERIDFLREVVDESPYTDTLDPPEDIKRLEMAKAKLSGFLDSPQLVFSKYPLSDQSEEARYARAVAYFRTASVNNALDEIQHLIDNNPENPYFYELKAQILYESGRGEESIDPIRRALELKPDTPLFEIALAQALVEQGTPEQLDEATALLKSALQKEQDNSFAWYYLSMAYSRSGNEPLAKYATAEQAYNMGDLQRARSFAYRAQQDLPRNLPQWRRASDIIVVSDAQLAARKNR